LVDYQLPAATAGGAAEIPLLITAVEQLNVDGVKVMVRRLKKGGEVSYFNLTQHGLIGAVRGAGSGGGGAVSWFFLLLKFTVFRKNTLPLMPPKANLKFSVFQTDEGRRRSSTCSRSSIPLIPWPWG
jgi:hypothetical protein